MEAAQGSSPVGGRMLVGVLLALAVVVALGLTASAPASAATSVTYCVYRVSQAECPATGVDQSFSSLKDALAAAAVHNGGETVKLTGGTHVTEPSTPLFGTDELQIQGDTS